MSTNDVHVIVYAHNFTLIVLLNASFSYSLSCIYTPYVFTSILSVHTTGGNTLSLLPLLPRARSKPPRAGGFNIHEANTWSRASNQSCVIVCPKTRHTSHRRTIHDVTPRPLYISRDSVHRRRPSLKIFRMTLLARVSDSCRSWEQRAWWLCGTVLSGWKADAERYLVVDDQSDEQQRGQGRNRETAEPVTKCWSLLAR